MSTLTPKQREEVDEIYKFPDRPVSQAAYARYANTSRQAVNNLVRRGVVQLTRDGKIIPRQADAERSAIAQVNVTAAPEVVGEFAGDVDTYKAARAKKEIHLARQAELKVKELEGELVSREAVDDFTFRTVRNARNKFAGLHKRLAPRLSTMTDHHEIKALIKGEVDRILQELDDLLQSGF